MAFTQADLDAVDRAIIELATGPGPNAKDAMVTGNRGRLRTISFSDGAVRSYSEATLPDLKMLRDLIREELSSAQTDITKRRPRIFRGRTSKGL